MSIRDHQEARLKELRAQSAALLAKRGALLDAATEEKRGLTEIEQKSYDEATTERSGIEAQIPALVERVAELVEAETREAAAAKSRVELGQTGPLTGGAHVEDPAVYRKGDPHGSYFRDLYRATMQGDAQAADRLRRNDAQRLDTEKRALSPVAGAGGEFAPPLWLISDFAALARAGRKFADSLGPANLPSGISSVNLPKVATGTTTAVQATANTALSQTDLTTTSVTSGISVYGGKQVVALQMLEQSGIPFDEVVLADIAADYARTFDKGVISGSNAGGNLHGVYTYFAASGTVNVTYTDAAPTVAKLYSKIAGAISGIETNRFVAPDVIWMTPARWNSFLAASDTTGRPLVVPSANSLNPIAVSGGVITEGHVGTLLGLPVITDANLPSTLGAGTQDVVMVGVRSDLRTWEGSLKAEVFKEPYADSNAVLYRAYAYSAQIPDRYTTSVSIIGGTGLIAPTF